MQTDRSVTIDISTSARPADELTQAIDQVKPGTKVIYARDWFLADAWLAATACALFEQGRVELAQQRIPTGQNDKFAYIAIKKRYG